MYVRERVDLLVVRSFMKGTENRIMLGYALRLLLCLAYYSLPKSIH